jgi:hypothetical protein
MENGSHSLCQRTVLSRTQSSEASTVSTKETQANSGALLDPDHLPLPSTSARYDSSPPPYYNHSSTIPPTRWHCPARLTTSAEDRHPRMVPYALPQLRIERIVPYCCLSQQRFNHIGRSPAQPEDWSSNSFRYLGICLVNVKGKSSPSFGYRFSCQRNIPLTADPLTAEQEM